MRSKKRHMHNRRRLKTRKTHMWKPKYFTRIFRGGGDFWNQKCEPDPELTPEIMETSDFNLYSFEVMPQGITSKKDVDVYSVL